MVRVKALYIYIYFVVGEYVRDVINSNIRISDCFANGLASTVVTEDASMFE